MTALAARAYLLKQVSAVDDKWINCNDLVWVSQVTQKEAPLDLHSFS